MRPGTSTKLWFEAMKGAAQARNVLAKISRGEPVYADGMGKIDDADRATILSFHRVHLNSARRQRGIA